jgi:micrococcal nuclease
MLLLLAAFLLYRTLTGEQSGEQSGERWTVPSPEQVARYRSEPGIRLLPEQLGELTPAFVLRVVDGDTLVVRLGTDEERVRLLGVDTPESVDPRRPVEEYGREAAAFTRSMLPRGARISLRFDVERRDQYGRLLAHVYLDDGTWLNALLVRAGFAQVMTVPPNVAHADFFRDLQRKARGELAGLWQIPANR